jgi:hypothetical protein
MIKTTNTDGQSRKTLASQLDRLDGILDGLSDGLNEAVASAVKEAVGVAVTEAVQAVLVTVLTDPALRAQLRTVASPDPAPSAGPTPEAEAGKGRLARLCGRVGDRLRSAGRAGAERLRRIGQAANLAWQLAGARVRAVLVAGAGVAAAAAAYLARTSLVAAAARLREGAKALAGRAWSGFKRALPALGLCGT